MKPLALLVVAAIALGAQDSPGPTFEVASVRVWQGDSGPPTSFSCKIDPAIFRCSAATLRTLLTYGYGVQSFQIEGPAWIDQEYYDISAKFPATGSSVSPISCDRIAARGILASWVPKTCFVASGRPARKNGRRVASRCLLSRRCI